MASKTMWVDRCLLVATSRFRNRAETEQWLTVMGYCKGLVEVKETPSNQYLFLFETEEASQTLLNIEPERNVTVSKVPRQLALKYYPGLKEPQVDNIPDVDIAVSKRNRNRKLDESNEDWRDGKSLAECFTFMLDNSKYTDVTFNVSDQQGQEAVAIRALRTVLVARSSVFEKMFCGELADKRDIIEITDIQPEAFNQMIRFMYSDHVDLSGENVMSVMYAAKKYMVSGLLSQCEAFLQKNLCPDNAAMLLEQSVLFDAEELQERCMEVIQQNTSTVLESQGFIHASRYTVKRVLESDAMNVAEIKVFEGSIAWAQAQCQKKTLAANPENVKATLGELLELIRFPTMSQEEFVNTVLPWKLIEDAVVIDLFKYFTSKNESMQLPFRKDARAAGGCGCSGGGYGGVGGGYGGCPHSAYGGSGGGYGSSGGGYVVFGGGYGGSGGGYVGSPHSAPRS